MRVYTIQFRLLDRVKLASKAKSYNIDILPYLDANELRLVCTGEKTIFYYRRIKTETGGQFRIIPKNSVVAYSLINHGGSGVFYIRVIGWLGPIMIPSIGVLLVASQIFRHARGGIALTPSELPILMLMTMVLFVVPLAWSLRWLLRCCKEVASLRALIGEAIVS